MTRNSVISGFLFLLGCGGLAGPMMQKPPLADGKVVGDCTAMFSGTLIGTSSACHYLGGVKVDRKTGHAEFVMLASGDFAEDGRSPIRLMVKAGVAFTGAPVEK